LPARDSPGEAGGGLPRGLATLLAVAAGVTVANIYYAQPLLPSIAESFSSTPGAVGYVPMLTQVGYSLGLLLFVPLGDVVERKGLILALVGASAVALLAVALAPGLPWLAAASFLVGLATVVPHVAVPLAAHLAAPADRGRVIGVVMSGVLVGILLARTASGFIGQALGWRAVFVLAAALVIALGVALRARLPRSPPGSRLAYPALLASLVTLARSRAEVREAAVLAASGFGAFSVFWATLAFFLAGPPHARGSGVAGLFGVVGVAGALAAPIVGRIADRRGPRATMGVAFLVALASFGAFSALRNRLWGIALGILLLDVGWQAAHVANLTRVHGLDAEARSRLNTVYMVTLFAGGACGTWAGVHAWSAWGWSGVCAAGASFVAVALAVWAAGSLRARAAG
jgi:predicted MFS family arabinose efflux permease